MVRCGLLNTVLTIHRIYYVGTTRPETIFGDVAIAIHPENKKLKKLLVNLQKFQLLKK